MAAVAPQTSAPTDGSRTLTLVPAPPLEEDQQHPAPNGSGSGSGAQPQAQGQPPLRGVLKLRGGPRSRPQVQWTEETVDNEGAGKKKSKSTLWKAPRAFDESSSEEESSDEDEGEGHGECGHQHHGHGHAHSRHNRPIGGGGEDGRGPPNAYEKQGAAGKGKAKAS